MIALNLSRFFEKLALIRDIRNYPIDLKVALLWTIGTILCVYLPFLQESLLRPVFGVLFLLIVPGYLFTAALFPSSDDIEWIERIALTFGLSIAVVPLIGLGLNYTPWGIRLTPIVTALVIFTLAMTGIAAYRRMILSNEQQLVIPIAEVSTGIRAAFLPKEATSIDRVLSALLFVAILVLIGTTVFVILFPQDGERFTEFYILGATGKAADYPTQFWQGARQSVTVGIENHEHRNVTYDVEVYGFNQQFDPTTNTSKIIRAVPLGSFKTDLGHNETFREQFYFTVNDNDVNRIQFLLFTDQHPRPPGDVPAAELVEQSYRNLHFWVTVDEAKPFFRSVDRVIEDRIINYRIGDSDLTGEWIYNAKFGTAKLIITQAGNKFWGDIDFPEYDFEDKIVNGVISGNIVSFKRENYRNYQYYYGNLTTDALGKMKMAGLFASKESEPRSWWTAIKK